jgi:hypothetical protein
MIQDTGLVIFILISHAIIMEGVGQYYVYASEDYKDLQVKIRNLGNRLKKLKHEYLYVPSTKKKQEGKMIKV